MVVGQRVVSVSRRVDPVFAVKQDDLVDRIDLYRHGISGFGVGQIFVVAHSCLLIVGQRIVSISCGFNGVFIIGKDRFINSRDEIYNGERRLGVGQVFVVAYPCFLIVGQRVVSVSRIFNAFVIIGKDHFINSRNEIHDGERRLGVGQVFVVTYSCLLIVGQFVISASRLVDPVFAVKRDDLVDRVDLYYHSVSRLGVSQVFVVTDSCLLVVGQRVVSASRRVDPIFADVGSGDGSNGVDLSHRVKSLFVVNKFFQIFGGKY